jgi:hypothetical protein
MHAKTNAIANALTKAITNATKCNDQGNNQCKEMQWSMQ